MSDALNLADPKIGLSEISENECRKDFTPSERIAYGKELEQVQRLKAEQRMLAGKKQTLSSKDEGVKNPRAGYTNHVVAQKVGMSEATYHRAEITLI